VEQDIVTAVAAVLVAGVAAQWLGWRLQIPAIVFLLAGGLLAGPVTGLLDPDRLLGDALFPLVSLAVAVILFEGALGLGWRGVREAGSTVWKLLTVGAFVTFAGTTLAARFLLDVQWDLALLLAAVLVVTGPTVIGPIVKAIGLRGRVAAILESEGTLIDPIGAILTVFVFQALFASEHGGSIVDDVVTTFGIGAGIGLAAAALLYLALHRFLLPDELHNVATLAVVISAFAVSNHLREESGLVAVTVMGIAMAAQSRVPVRRVLEFNATLRILFISGLFVLLGARISSETLRQIEWRNIAFLAALVLVVRPLCVLVSTLGSRLGREERLFLALTAPRGIVAAAVASLFSFRLAEAGVEGSQVLVSASFTVIGGTVLLSGLVSRRLGMRLGLIASGRGTVIVLGANPFATEFAAALQDHDVPARLIDVDPQRLSGARMKGLPTQRGSVISDATWEAAGIKDAASFVAMTQSDEINALAVRHAAEVLGRKQVFQLAPRRPEHEVGKQLPVSAVARTLFTADATIEVLNERLADGWRIASTRITDRFGADQHADVHRDAIPLFVVGRKGRVDLIAVDTPRKPKPGDVLVTLTRSSNGG
jgi:NhaP-type Na+/H+ or K+/H+ antiporter